MMGISWHEAIRRGIITPAQAKQARLTPSGSTYRPDTPQRDVRAELLRAIHTRYPGVFQNGPSPFVCSIPDQRLGVTLDAWGCWWAHEGRWPALTDWSIIDVSSAGLATKGGWQALWARLETVLCDQADQS